MTETPLKLLQIDLTDECPLCCAHCSNSSGPGRDTHFPANTLIKIVQEAKLLGVERIVYSGGEPLRYPHLEKALYATQVAGISTTIFTTGIEDKQTRLPVPLRRWLTLKQLGLTAARFSIYASPLHRELHNNIVRTKPASGDAFGVNEQAIRDTRDAGIAVELHFIPCSATVGDVAHIYRWAVSLGCATLHLQVPTYQGRNKEGSSLGLNGADETRLKEAAQRLKPVVGSTEFYISRFWRSRWNMTTDLSCAASPEQLIIRRDGTVSPCNACKYGNPTHAENIFDAGVTLGSIWRDSRTLGEVRTARSERRIPLRCERVLATSHKVEAH